VPGILLVEDEESFVEALSVGLRREGFDVHVARDGKQALALFDHVHPDLVLLDVMLPELSGIDVCKALRARSRVPIVMVSAKTSEVDTIVGLEVGADDYVTKPYRLRELVARVRAVLRRRDDTAERAPDDAVTVGDVTLDVARHEVVVRGEHVHLPLREFEVCCSTTSVAS
jgi:two-component system response regulator RegX3